MYRMNLYDVIGTCLYDLLTSVTLGLGAGLQYGFFLVIIRRKFQSIAEDVCLFLFILFVVFGITRFLFTCV